MHNQEIDHEEIRTALAQRLRSCPSRPNFNGRKGIVICGGGYWYFTNAYINIRLIRELGCRLPIELWMFTHECDDAVAAICAELGVTLRLVTAEEIADPTFDGPGNSRWQWVLKPYSIVHSAFTEVLMLDADSFPVTDPSLVFDLPAYQFHGAVFWPDFGVTEKERAIWDIMGVPYRPEPEFETGQIVIDKRQCWEPLQLALWMNQRADFFYHIIWGDKDTFRFAWHKYGRSFGMCPFPIQPLDFPGGPKGTGVMCQHDFEGNRLFQHRNLAKWNLRGENPRIAGYLFEKESEEFLNELRGKWNGRVNLKLPTVADLPTPLRPGARKLLREICEGRWLLEDNRALPSGCCSPPTLAQQRVPLPWDDVSEPNTAEVGQPPPAVFRRNVRAMPIEFLLDQSVEGGWLLGAYWWALVPAARNRWEIVCYQADHKVSFRLRQKKQGWTAEFKSSGDLKKQEPVGEIRLFRLEQEYPALQKHAGRPVRKISRQPRHVAQHAFGIGDAITGLYACMGAVRAGQPIIYHTRHPQWLSRVRQPGLTITADPPPPGTPDFNTDYPEQLRHATDKARWYSQFLTDNTKNPPLVQPPFPPARPKVDRKLQVPRLDFPRYVLVAPFAAWANRDWLPGHWRRLAFLLEQAGYTMVVIGTKKEEERILSTFNQSYAFWAIEHPPEWIMDAMLGAKAFIGLDSGMVHLAGLLSVPTVCIHAHLPPEFLFSCAPSIHSVTPGTACQFCRWQMDRLYNTGCNDMCSALCSIGPEQVLARFLEIVRR